MNIDLNQNPERWPDECTRLLSASPAVLYACGPGPDYPTTFITENVATQLGCQPEEFYERPSFWTERIHPDDVACVLRELSCIEQGKRLSYEYRFRHQDGHFLWLHDELTPLKDADGKVVGLVGSWFDISERKRAEEALKESEQLLAKTLDNLHEAVFIVDADTVEIRDCNRAAERIFGYRRDEMVGQTTTFLHADEAALEEFRRHLYPAVEKHGFLSLPAFRMKRKDGTVFFTEHTVTQLHDHQGRRVAWVSVVRDVTERKRAEEALRQAHDELERRVEERTAELAHANQALQESRERLRSLVETTSDWIWEVDRSGRYTYASPKVRELLGYEPEDVIGRTPFELMPAEEAERVRGLFRDAAASRRPFQGLENVNLHKDGHPVVLETSGVPILGADGKLLGYRGIDRDITARKRAEEALRESEQRFRILFENTPIGLYRTTPEGRIVDANPALVKMLGYSSLEELAQRNLEEEGFEPQCPRAEFRQQIEREGSVTLRETTWRKRDGSLILVRENAQVTRDADDRVAYYDGTVEDVTERRRAEEALRESERRYRAIVEDQTELICRWVPGYRHTFVNDAYCRCFGKSREELIGQSFVPLIPEEDHPRALEHFVALCRENPVASHEHRVIAVGGEIRWHQWTDRAIFDEHGNIVEYQSVGRDITERRQAEEALRESKEELQAIYDGAVDGMLILDNQTREFVRANPAICEMLGHSKRELLSMSLADIVPSYQLPQATAAFAEAAEGKRSSWTNIPLLRKNGELFFVDIGARSINYRGRRCTIGFFRDITERKRAEEKLRLFSQAVESSSDCIAMGNLEYKITYVNEEFARTFGYSREELVGKDISFVYAEEQIPKLEEALEATMKGSWTGELIGRRKNGELFPVAISSSTVVDHEGNVIAQMASHRDITEPKRAEEALQESEELFRTVVDASKDAMVAINRDGLVTLFNPAAEEMFGRKTEEVIGQPLDCLMPEQYRAPHRQYVEQYFRTGAPREAIGQTLELPAMRKDGAVFPVELSLSVGQRGNEPFVLAVIRDITERKRAEEARRESERKSRAILDHTFQFIGLMRPDGVLTEANRTALDFAGIEESDVLGKLFWETPWWAHSSELQDRLRDAVSQAAAGHFVRFEATHPAADGTLHSVDFSLKPLKDEAGNVSLLIPEGRDITERKRAEETLRKQTEILENVLAHIPHSVFWKDTKSVYLGCNENFAREAGLATPEQIVGKTDYDLPWSREQTEFYRQCDQEVITTGRSLINIEEPCRWADGSQATVMTSKTPLRDLKGQVIGVLGIYADITERKRAEETLRRQALVFDNMYDGVIVIDTEGRIADWNPGAERMFGYTKAEILGQPPETLDRPQDAAALTASIGAGLARDGRWSGEFHVVRKDGSERVCEGVVVRLSDQDGRELGRVSVNRDITDRLRAEEEVRRRQEELAHVTRLATMGEMATGLAHELNQPLSAILYYARGCERRLRAGGWDVDEVLGAIDKVAAQADRAATFIDRLRTFLGRGGPHLAPIDLNQVVREAVGFIEHDVRENHVNIDFQLSAPLRPVLADMIQTEQVILNLLRNGIESMQETEPAERRLILQTSGAGSEAITVAVADNGCGCSDEVAERLFDAFFTTKPDGMGMGLAVSRSIIEAHGGRLWATPNPNGGTTFRFTLPVAPGGRMS